MADTTILEKLNLLFKFIKDNSFLILIVVLVLIILVDLLYGKNTKRTKLTYRLILFLLVSYFVLIYNKPLLNVIDVYVTNVFKIMYFPSIIEYFTMILVTIIIQLISLKIENKFIKNLNLWIGFIIEILFISNIVAMNNTTVNLLSITTIYENDLLLSIFQLTGIIFVIWLIFNILVLIVSKLLEKRIEMPRLKEEYME